MGSNTLIENAQLYQNTIDIGKKLMEAKMEEGGWGEMFDESKALAIKDPVIAAHTAVMLENCRRWLGSLHESTRSVAVGGFVDYLYPIIRASFPNNPVNRLVSVQPQTKKIGMVYWLNYIIGRTIGMHTKGETLYDANNGWNGKSGYTDEKVYNESAGAVAGAAAQTFTLAETPVRPGTLRIELGQSAGAATIAIADNGNGGLTLVSDGGTGRTLTGTNTINYVTGAVTVTFDMALVANAANLRVIDYAYDGEMNERLPQIDVEMQSAGVSAVRRAVSLRYSIESLQDFSAEFGMNLDQTIITGCAQALITDTAAEVIGDLWDMAGASAGAFNINGFTGISRVEHYGDVRTKLTEISGLIYEATQRGEGTWLVVDTNAYNILSSMPDGHFVPAAGNPNKQQGVTFVGTLDGKFEVFRYKQLKDLPGAAAAGNILMGYKGEDFFDAGYVYAPYQALYTSGPDNRADLSTRQAWATRYAKKRLNAGMYKRMTLTTA